jgi:DNA-directed RNA polymerase subunit N (RpoN/RPB10)
MNVVRSSTELVNVSIRCRCQSLVTYQCSAPSSGSSQYETVTQLEIPLYCYSCGRLVTKLYLNSPSKAAHLEGQHVTDSSSSVTLSIHPQNALDHLFSRAQASSLISPPTAHSMSSGPETSHQSVSSLPAINVSSHDVDETSDSETDDLVAQSPSARPGTILPMIP